MEETNRRVPIDAQQVDAPLSQFAVFLTVTIRPDSADLATAREVVAGLDDLAKTVGFRDMGANSLRGRHRVGRVGSAGPGRPPRRAPALHLHHAGGHTAPSTPGDLLFHIRADRADLCFEFERLLLEELGDAVEVVDEVQGFRYFDARDLLGFVDGTANPSGAGMAEATLIGDEDPAFAGGSYVVVQKYLHDLAAWNAMTTEEQEAVIGRRKADNVELDDTEPQKAHKTLTTITDEHGEELEILRDNMPFGSPASGSSAPTSSATRAASG